MNDSRKTDSKKHNLNDILIGIGIGIIISFVIEMVTIGVKLLW